MRQHAVAVAQNGVGFGELESLGFLGLGFFGEGCGLSGHWMILLNWPGIRKAHCVKVGAV